MGKYPTGPALCSETPGCEIAVPDLKTSPFTWVLVGYILIVLIATGCWYVWKRLGEARVTKKRTHPEISPSSSSSISSGLSFCGGVQGVVSSQSFTLTFRDSPVEVEGETGVRKMGETELEHYEDCLFGKAVNWLWMGVFVMWAVLFLILIYGYYDGCQVSGADNLCFYGSYSMFGSFEQNAELFFATWVLASAHMSTWFFLRKSLVNFFRMKCKPARATHVKVTVQGVGKKTEEDQEEEETEMTDVEHTSFAGAVLGWLIKVCPEGMKGRLKAFASRLAAREEVRQETMKVCSVVLPFSKAAVTADGPAPPQVGGEVEKEGVAPGHRLRFFLFEGKRFVLWKEQKGFTEGEQREETEGRTEQQSQQEPTSGRDGEATFKIAQVQVPPTCAALLAASRGRGEEQAKNLLALVGPNEIPFKVDSVVELIKNELSQFFYVYQLIMYIIWLWASYLFVGALLLGVAMIAAIAKMVVRRAGQVALAEITAFEATVRVKREGKWTEKSSKDIVPGDVVAVSGNRWPVPCDLAVLSGSAVVDESALTGESRPVQKTHVETEGGGGSGDAFSLTNKRCVKHLLFAGTDVMQVTGGDEGQTDRPGEITAVAVATGMQSSKGQLLATMLFPERLRFKYDRELPLVFILLLLYGAVNFALAIWFQLSSGQPAFWVTRFTYGAFTVSQILSPLLPVALVVGQIRSSARLKQAGIVCVNPGRIAISGKVRVFCFDKTGTLTKDCLDFLGAVVRFRPVTPQEPEPAGKILTPSEEGAVEAMGPEMYRGLSCCHSLASLENPKEVGGPKGKEALVGNEVEREMFASTGGKLLPCREGGGEGVAEVSLPNSTTLTVLRRWDFDHARMTMSVAVFVPSGGQSETQQQSRKGKLEVYCKGSYEAVTAACVPESIPEGAKESFRHFALRGCYVLALASRTDGITRSRRECVTAAEGMGRDEAEQGLTWRGLLLFRNELKPDTAGAIREMREAGVRPVMITGDTPFCGAFIAGEAKLWGPLSLTEGGEETEEEKGGMHWEQLLADVEIQSTSGGGETSQVMWRSLRNPASAPWTTQEVEEAMRSRVACAAEEVKGLRGGPRVAALMQAQSLELAATGKAFAVLRKGGHLGVGSPLLFGLRCLARMSPAQKIEAVELYRAEGLVVGMCGDGGNDCGALRKAHCGVALSAAEASAVAPFTARNKSVCDVVTVLKEGRCALQTSLSCYKFLVLYGLLFSVLKICSFWFGVLMCQMAYIMIDGVAVLGLSYVMSVVGPRDRLAKDNRPTSALLGSITVWSLLGMWIIDLAFLAGALSFIQNAPNYIRFPTEYSNGFEWWTLSDNWEASTLFAVIYAQFVTGAVVFSFGYEFRQSVFKSLPVLVLGLILFGFTLFLILSPSNAATRLFHMATENYNAAGTVSPAWKGYQEAGNPPSDISMGVETRGGLAALVIANAIALILWQKCVVEGPLGRALRIRFPAKRPLVGS
uniref:P-type ATPase A domain-containing protein n=1 Tax=Chromera velia CCMP2878 TaxID=1169474 RepID=A0A0G4HJG7_9ALVE|eukprot:Cvel_7085.t1-p1 / transcript=Cvel_7085.t1 / gene=Cvel_7085 / organism=Chromera_velia_CCMP2878 / gene_product=Probable cation-transporting ATPase 13A3, putative / transcript_product=Probable cation-transporting ATPase 13A3, putative / location=Cvel_scaffold362:53591-59345(-) / protein_length=1463 / sequence_SO=supercontig / SO=protein_coding / is_pseudo=false